MIHVPVRFVTESLGIAPQTAAREPQRRPISRYADRGRASRSLRGLETRGTAGCCIRSKSSRFQAHPFREGNGRSTKLYLEHVAERSPFQLEYDKVPRDVWNRAAELSRPDLGSYKVVPASVVPVFRHIATERPTPQPTAAPKKAEPPKDRSMRGTERYRGGTRDNRAPGRGPRGIER